jgi:hypothetical protein
MKSCDVVGYVYDADTHCAYCAIARFGQHPNSPVVYPWCRDDRPDSEGNTPAPIFADTEFGRAVTCADCSEALNVNVIPHEGEDA